MGCKEQQHPPGSEEGEEARGPQVEDHPQQRVGRSRSATAAERSRLNFRRLKDIEVVGDPIRGKKDGELRVWYENFDGFPISSTRDRNGKVKKLNLLRKRLDLDIIGGSEVQIDWSLMDRKHSLEEVLQTDGKIRASSGYNEHECVGKRQQGGVCTVVYADAAVRTTETGKDRSGLGRWSWAKIAGCRGRFTRVITAYQPVRSRKKGYTTVYRQQQRHFSSIGRHGCPRRFFREDLREFLLQCIAQNERVILMLDANENMGSGKLARIFQEPGIDLVDAVKERTRADGPPTWFRGSAQIDGIWVSKGIAIQRAAFLPFFIGIGDHRPILVDFSSDDILQEQSVKIKVPEMRRLQCDNPVVLQRYNERLEELFRQHKVLDKVRELNPWHTTMSNREWIENTERLDLAKQDLMRAAEKRCRKLCTGGIPFSPEVEVAKRRVSVWKKVIFRKEGGRTQKKYIRRLARSCGIQSPFQCTLEAAKRNLATAEHELEAILPKAEDLRIQFLRSREEDEDEDKERAARCAKRKKETLRRSWRVLRKAFGRGHMGSVKVVEVHRDGSWQRIRDREGIEASIMQENSKRFRLTEGTPLMSAVSKALFGQLADTEMVEQVLRGEFDYSLVEPDLAQFLRLFAQAQQSQISTEVSAGDFQQYWRKARERTASSISGLHFGHYKAAASSDLLSFIHAACIESAFSRGYPLRRWTRGLSCMLEKEEGVVRVDKLRAILLLEADFNFATKLLVGKRMVDSLEQEGALADEQFGSRKQRSSIEVALNRRLLSDISRQQRKTVAIAGVDAAHCYDRVAHPFAIMACRAIGVPKAIMQTIFSAVQQMKMRVRTAFGESTEWYGGNPETPFQGLCQGNGCGPAVWLVVSMFVVRFLKLKGRVSRVWSALSGLATEILGLMFVDDSDLVHFAEGHEAPGQVADDLNTTVQCWQKGLAISGGTLRPEKCYWYLLDYEWVDGKVRYDTREHREIHVQDARGVEGRVQRLQPQEAKEVVGVWIAPDGNNTAQMASLITKIERMTGRVRECAVPVTWMWRGFLMGMWKSVAYPLGACTLSEGDCATLAKQIYGPILPVLGVNRNMPTVMRYAPARYGGLSLPSPELEQGIQQLRLLLEHGPEQTLSGKLIRTSFEQLQLEVGELTQVLSLPYRNFHFLATDAWVKQIWRFCSQKEIKVQWFEAILPLKLREWDRGIMDSCRAVGIRSPSQQVRINRVRCHLQVITLADIVTPDGRRIRQEVLDGVRWNRRNNYKWGKEQPSDGDWAEWRRAMVAISSHTGTLSTPLGRWIAAPHIQHEWIWGVTDGFLYKYLGGRHQWWQRFRPTSIAGNTFEGNHWTRRPPEHFQVAQVEEIEGNRARWISGMEVRSTISADKQNKRIRDVRLDTWIRKHVRWHVELAWARNKLRRGHCRIVTDGSYMKERSETLGSAAWIFETEEGVRICSGSCLTSGGVANPYRAELTGLYGVFATLYWCIGGEGVDPRTEIGCDCQGAIVCASWDPRKTSCSSKHHDIRRALSHLRRVVGLQIKLRHISGHQDDLCAWRNLSRWEQLNVVCDTAAKKFLSQNIAEGRVSPAALPTEQWCCWAGAKRITGDLHSPILVSATTKEMKAKLAQYGVLSQLGFTMVDWDLVDRSRASLSLGLQIWLMKHMSGFCGSGIMMRRMGLWDNHTCRCCLQRPEDSPWHILDCTHSDLIQERRSMLEELRQWMEKNMVEEWLADVLLRFLRDGGWPMDWDGSLSTLQVQLLQSMERIGVRGLLLGFLPRGMVAWQKDCFSLMGVQRSAGLLLSRLSSQLLLALHKLWKLRCDIVHERDASGLYVEVGRDLRQQIRHEFQRGREGLQESAFHLFDEPEQELLLKPLAVKISWLRDVHFGRGELNQAREVGRWLKQKYSRKRDRKTQEDLVVGKRQRLVQTRRIAQQQERQRQATPTLPNNVQTPASSIGQR